MADRRGIEIDYRPRCGGVWLDRGEDKIIARNTSFESPRRVSAQQMARDRRDEQW